MLKSLWRLAEFRLRVAVLWLTLFSQLMLTFGFPLPAPRRSKSSSGIAYPCQSRPCGCLTSEECWKGDCCCFTIEQKLLWAESNDIEPPEHVRSLVESRISRTVQTQKKSCCEKEKSTTQLTSSECTSDQLLKSCCDKKTQPQKDSGVRWVLGMFARKCRGDGPQTLLQPVPVTVDFPRLELPLQPDPQPFDHPVSVSISPQFSTPPSPPPKHV
jgi:hypothetical protein